MILVNGEHQTGALLTTDGWRNPGAERTPSVGDAFTLMNERYTIVGRSPVNDGGNCILQVWPHIVTAPPNNAELIEWR